MEHIKKQVLDRCIKQLNALGAKYAIVVDDEKFGELEIVTAALKPRRTVNKRRWVNVVGFVREELKALEVGDVAVLKVPEGEDISAFQSLVSRVAAELFGKGTEGYMTAQLPDKSGVETLRLQ